MPAMTVTQSPTHRTGDKRKRESDGSHDGERDRGRICFSAIPSRMEGLLSDFNGIVEKTRESLLPLVKEAVTDETKRVHAAMKDMQELNSQNEEQKAVIRELRDSLAASETENTHLQKELEKARAQITTEKKLATRAAAKAKKSEKYLIALQSNIEQALVISNIQQKIQEV